MKSFSFNDRNISLQNMKSQHYDLIIIGGGITGAGTARDAAMRGMKVALIEARDFASGTSSKSSKLIHGGIRYLENKEFKLVFEALNERTKLFEMAPHLVHPLRFMIPVYKQSRVGMFLMGIGMWLYDALALFQVPEMHERLNAKESVEKIPSLNAKDLCGSYVYSDAYMDDDRLVFETLRSAHDNGAHIANYVQAVGVKKNENGHISHVKVRDELTKQEFYISANHVVSSVGPWTDQLGQQIFEQWKNILRPTKGIHLTLKKERLPLSSAVVMGAEKGNRIVFGIPRHEMVIVGTTDTDFKGDPKNIEATIEDVDYLIAIVNEYFPGAQITKKDIISSYAGVRPLVSDGAENEGKTSREHVIFTLSEGITFVAGGKYTTYRLMSEQIVDEVLNQLSIEDRQKFKICQTEIPINPLCSAEKLIEAKSKADYFSAKYQKKLSEILLLVERWGMEAEEIISHHPRTMTYWQLEAEQAIQNTMCLNLEDFYRRRVPLYLADEQHGVQYIDEIAEIFKINFNWDNEKTENEKLKYLNFVKTDLKWKN